MLVTVGWGCRSGLGRHNHRIGGGGDNGGVRIGAGYWGGVHGDGSVGGNIGCNGRGVGSGSIGGG